MRFDSENEEFTAQALAWLQSLDEEVRGDLQAVLRLSPGYYPTTLAQLWLIEVAEQRPRAAVMPGPVVRQTVELPVPHPADYEWRFTESAAHALLGRATANLPDGAPIVHIGTPTTFLLGCERYNRFRHVLLEGNSAATTALAGIPHVYCINLMRTDPPALEARVAIVDPPWYPAETRAFLMATNHTCMIGARILLCQPTMATRPGAAEERATLLDDLPQLGFACVDVGVGHVRYRMPHFEASSLKVTAPHLPVPTDWRAGDVLVLEKVADSNMSRPSDLDMELWRDCRFGPVRIKTRHTKGTDLGSLVAGDVLDTVSRRDPIRQQIGLWTSGNRVFSLTHDRAISKLIDLCHSDLMRSQFSEASTRNHARKLRLTSRIASRLFHLLLVEFQEHTIQKDLQVP